MEQVHFVVLALPVQSVASSFFTARSSNGNISPYGFALTDLHLRKKLKLGANLLELRKLRNKLTGVSV